MANENDPLNGRRGQQQNKARFDSLTDLHSQQLSLATNEYTYHGYSPDQDIHGVYYPDAIIEAFATEAGKLAAQIYQAHEASPHELALLKTRAPILSDPKLSLSECKAIILAALSNFDSELGEHAANIFAAGFDDAIHSPFMEKYTLTNDAYDGDPIVVNNSRWRIKAATEGQEIMMRQCVTANSVKTPFNPANANPHAVIQFEHNGTFGDLIDLAHELGHAIADDNIRKAGSSYEKNPKHLAETQAYFIQHILYDYLLRNGDQKLAHAAQRHSTAVMTKNLYQIPISLVSLRIQQGQNAASLDAWIGPNWRKYEPAKIFDETIQKAVNAGDVQTKQKILADQIGRIHERPMGIMTAQVILNQTLKQDQESRRATSKMLLGVRGPKNITKILAQAGIRNSKDMASAARSTVKSIATNLNGLLQQQQQAQQQQSQHLKSTPNRPNYAMAAPFASANT